MLSDNLGTSLYGDGKTSSLLLRSGVLSCSKVLLVLICFPLSLFLFVSQHDVISDRHSEALL